jgi:superfamily II DNA or RNA helicase
MNFTNGYIYVRNHPSYDVDDACKMGKANNIPERDTQYATGEIKRGYFEVVFEVLNDKTVFIERLLQNKFRELNIKNDAGTEFYNRKIITLIEPYLIKLGIRYKKLSKQEISYLIGCYRIRKIMKKIDIQTLINTLKSKITNKQYIWNERNYQRTIINFSKNELLTQNKLYIELPTGGGKSYIVYNLFDYLKSEFIIIVSPRKIVNSQNISQKYLEILKDNYSTFNYSIDNNFDEYLRLSNKKIVICCTQSIDKIYEKILSNSITNITIWFDEAHWGIEEWIKTLNDNVISQFWLLNNKHIKYRIYTSASPNKPKVLQHENIFGKLYTPIKVKELINLNWLSSIKPYVYSENKENVDNIKYIISDFFEKERSFGFSFHNKQKNAFNLFYKHYIQYKNDNTYIKPFLLVSDNFTVEKEPKLQEIILEYDYRNIKTFETTIYSIGYVVAKYNMGYDFNKLDFICLSDPKLSPQDIIQSIGRGIRPDLLGQYGSNKEKILVISLPVYVYENGDNKYEKIVEVLKYLLYDIEIPFEEIEFKNRYTSSFKEVKNNSNEYIGINDIKSTLLNLLELENSKTTLATTYEKARKIIADKNIKSKESYYELCEIDNRLSKEPEIVFKGQFTNWIEYLCIERKYYDLETCKNKVDEYLLLYPDIQKHYFDLSIVSKKLCILDMLFPPNGLWVEYYDVTDLQYIINITNKKKKISSDIL